MNNLPKNKHKQHVIYTEGLPKGYVIKHDPDFLIKEIKQVKNKIIVFICDKETDKNYSYAFKI